MQEYTIQLFCQTKDNYKLHCLSNRQYPVSDEELNESEIIEIEVAKAEIARGEYVGFEDLKREYGIS